MHKMMNFSTENLRTVFAAEGKYENFETLRHDLISGNQIYDFDDNGNRYEISKKDGNKAVRKVFMEICGLDEETVKNNKLRKRAIKQHGMEIFEVTEQDIEFKVETGLTEDEWFNRFVESRNERLGDTTEFYSKTDIVLAVAEVSGDYHDFNCRVRIA